MSVAVRHRRRAGGNPLPVTVVAGLFGLLAAVALVSAAVSMVTGRSDPSDRGAGTAREREALEGYVAALAPAAERAGHAIVRGVRPDVVEFRAGRLSAEVWMADMDSYAAELETARSVFARTKAPASVGDAKAWFEKAFRVYADALATLKSAGTATGERREELISRGTRMGDQGDDLYDKGATLVQRARRAAGLPPDARFPGA